MLGKVYKKILSMTKFTESCLIKNILNQKFKDIFNMLIIIIIIINILQI